MPAWRADRATLPGMALRTASILLALALADTARADEKRVTQAAIDAAIDRGVAHLRAQYADGIGRGPVRGPQASSLLDHPGLRALTAYTLLKSGVPSSDPTVRALFGRLAFERFDTTYDASCMLLALCAAPELDCGSWAGELTLQLLRWRQPRGDWGYPAGGDLSNTQFAALALRAAAQQGAEVPSNVWSGLARALFGYQSQDGGFGYVAGGAGATGSMTAAGVGLLAIVESELARAGELEREARLIDELRLSRAGGLDWLAKNFAVDHNPRHGAWKHYYLYGLERVGAYAGVERIGVHEWYAEGARHLVATQDGQGEWAGTFEREGTLFALLFLRRASAVARNPRTVAPGERIEAPRVREPGAARIEVLNERPAHLALAGFSQSAVEAFEWPKERGRGPRVVLVEYLVDGRVAAAVLADGEQPSDGHGHAALCWRLTPGEHLVQARIHVRVPEHELARRRKADIGGLEPLQALYSDQLAIQVASARPTVIRARTFAPLLTQGEPQATSSSTYAGKNEVSTDGFPPRLACDANPRTPWLPSLRDRTPRLTLTLKHPQQADTLEIWSAELVASDPPWLEGLGAVSVRINGAKALAATPPLDAHSPFTLRLAEAQQVRTIELLPEAPVHAERVSGIGEVVLSLSRP